MNRFDKIINRKNTNSLKYDETVKRGKPEDILPMWVADMDFEVPEAVTTALQNVVSHGIFGYSVPDKSYAESVCAWFAKRHGWKPDVNWIVRSPGVVFALSAAIRAFTKEGDAILIQEPVYYPFRSVVTDNKRLVVNNELLNRDGHYEVDFDDFERKIVENQVRLFILCSPHNPVGRVWKLEELKAMGEICRKHDVFVVADEIHCDFTYPGHHHIPFASISEDFCNHSMICTSPSKTFNLAGLQISNIFLADAKYRRELKKEIYRTGYDESSPFALAACKAAYFEGAEWLDELLVYLDENKNYVRTYLKENLPKVKLIEPEGTYLLWLDFSECDLCDAELEEYIVKDAKVWLDRGSMFGKQCGQYERMNIACPRSVIKEALERLLKGRKRK